jgi:hypothetical protein
MASQVRVLPPPPAFARFASYGLASRHNRAVAKPQASTDFWCSCDKSLPDAISRDQAAAVADALQVTNDFAGLVGFTRGACSPAADGTQCSLVCISDSTLSGKLNSGARNHCSFSGQANAGCRVIKSSRVSFANRELLKA